jgi:hypothetical protein
MDGDSISRESHVSVKQEYVTIPDVSREGDPQPELVYFITQRINISEKYARKMWMVCSPTESD